MQAKRFIAIAVLLIAGVAQGAPSKAAQEWRNGPDKWLMTADEQKAWKSVSSDAEAALFIDLFWARRDPTPGTPRNEAREEFLKRVAFADIHFKEKRRRGAMTERGQIFILLGEGNKGEAEAMTMQGHSGMSSASARSAERLEWKYPREVAVAAGVPKMEVAFTQIIGSDQFVRDVRHGQFSNAHPAILNNKIKNPGLTALPPWAASVSGQVLTGVTPAPRADVKASGRIGRVLLLTDLNALDLDAAADPFQTLPAATSFAVDSDLAYLIEYCGQDGPLKVEMKVRDLTAASELAPAAMKAVAGCGAVPGMLSLSGLKPGSYDLQITTIEANGGRLTTTSKFQIR